MKALSIMALKNTLFLFLVAVLMNGCVSGFASKEAYKDLYYDRCFNSNSGERPSYCDR